MDNEALLEAYLVRLREVTQERLNEGSLSVMEALKDALAYLEGELKGY